MIQSVYRDILINIRNEEQKISLSFVHIIEESYQMTLFLKELLLKLKKRVLKKGFRDETEEIQFFKQIKPQLLGKLIYYNKVYRIETSCPVSSGKIYQKYFSNELEELKQEYKEQICNSDFYRYYRAGRTDRDKDYFRLGNIKIHHGLSSFAFEVDSEFSTYYDYKVARIIANELLHTYLLSKITTFDNESSIISEMDSAKDFYWTESKNALIELIYALYIAGCISRGKVGIRKMAMIFQVLFRIQLGDFHHAFHRMKQRNGSRTVFIDKLKASMESYMDKDL